MVFKAVRDRARVAASSADLVCSTHPAERLVVTAAAMACLTQRAHCVCVCVCVCAGTGAGARVR